MFHAHPAQSALGGSAKRGGDCTILLTLFTTNRMSCQITIPRRN
jgi:hypothetical protein